MKQLVIIGAGDFGREVSWVVERINELQGPQWELLGFLDDAPAQQGRLVDGYPVLGPVFWLNGRTEAIYVVCAVGTGAIRKAIMEKVMMNPAVRAATLVDPAAIVGRDVTVGAGSVVCAGTVLTIGVTLEEHVIVNLNCTVGHDAVLEDFCTVNPGCNLSGRVWLGACTDVGTGSKIIQGVRVAPGAVLGAGAVLVRDVTEPGTYVGVPARRILK